MSIADPPTTASWQAEAMIDDSPPPARGVTVRRATERDIDDACAVLADAFADSPWTRWTVDADRHGERIEALQRLAMERLALPFGEVWVACEGQVIVGVAMWMLPDVDVPANVSRAVDPMQQSLEGERHDASRIAEAAAAHLRPSDPHYFLGTVGVQLDCQRRGIGAALLQPVLNRATAEAACVYLETSTPENVAFYQGLGFTVTGDQDIPDAGPHVWAMMRR